MGGKPEVAYLIPVSQQALEYGGIAFCFRMCQGKSFGDAVPYASHLDGLRLFLRKEHQREEQK